MTGFPSLDLSAREIPKLTLLLFRKQSKFEELNLWSILEILGPQKLSAVYSMCSSPRQQCIYCMVKCTYRGRAMLIYAGWLDDLTALHMASQNGHYGVVLASIHVYS